MAGEREGQRERERENPGTGTGGRMGTETDMGSRTTIYREVEEEESFDIRRVKREAE